MLKWYNTHNIQTIFNTPFIQTCAYKWTVNEVCYWLITIGLQEYVTNFHSNSIDGKALLSHTFNKSVLKNTLNINSLHTPKILQSIHHLRQHQPKKTWKDGKNDSIDSNIQSLQNEISRLKLKFENQLRIHKQSEEKTNLSHNINIRSIKSIYEAHMESLQIEVEDKSSMIELLQQDADDNNQSQRMEIEKYKNRALELQDGYIKLERHYQRQLNDSNKKSKKLQLKLKNINYSNENVQQKCDLSNKLSSESSSFSSTDNTTTVDIGFEMKFNVIVTDSKTTSKNVSNEAMVNSLKLENEELKNNLKVESMTKVLLQSKLQMLTFELNLEKQKRTLLESQTQRLTQELTKYLTPRMFSFAIVFHIFYNFDVILVTENITVNDEKVAYAQRTIDASSVNAGGGWLKFLSLAAAKTRNISIPVSLKKKKTVMDDEIYKASLMNSMSSRCNSVSSMVFHHHRGESNISLYFDRGKKIGESVSNSVGSVRRRISTMVKKGGNISPTPVDDDNDIHNQSFVDISDVFVFPVEEQQYSL